MQWKHKVRREKDKRGGHNTYYSPGLCQDICSSAINEFEIDYCKKIVFFHKKRAKMAHNETVGYWRAGQNAPIFILTPKNEFLVPNYL